MKLVCKHLIVALSVCMPPHCGSKKNKIDSTKQVGFIMAWPSQSKFAGLHPCAATGPTSEGYPQAIPYAMPHSELKCKQ